LNRKKYKPYKVSRGSLEEQKLREDNHMETQRALLFILPVVMVAVLLVGLFFGYKSYEKAAEQVRELEHAAAEEPTAHDPMFLLTVNSARPLSEDYVPALTAYEGVQVSPDMTDALTRMLSAAHEAGYDIRVSEGYISFEEQRKRYEKAVKDYRAAQKASVVKAEANVKRTTPRAGESEQQTGLIVRLTADVDGKFQDSREYAWLIKNSGAYGFVLRYPDKENTGGLSFSPYLFRYVGEENAYFMTAYDMNFDAYAAYLASQ